MKDQASKQKISCAVVGARGYAGLELAKLLLRHSHAQLTHCFATNNFNLHDFLGTKASSQVICLSDSEILSNLADVVFLATPAEVSLKLAPKILEEGKTVIDLSGAFRLKKNDYQKFYGFEHSAHEYLAQAQVGLSPWIGPSQKEKLVANPGCYATAVMMALIPVLKNNLIKENGIVIDAKSGATGAGKKAAENLLFTEVDGECLPYKVGHHQHYPEIVEALEAFSGKNIDAHMTTSLIPVRRGIIAGIYARLTEGVGVDDVKAAFDSAYGDYSLVKHGPVESEPNLMSLKKVVGTARTHISYFVDGNKLYLFSIIDNLLKGAASQAVENFNRLVDLPLSTGVEDLEPLI